MQVDGCIKLIDSMSFPPMPLSGFTKAFGLLELRKGFFPHFFNTLENQQYVGPMPARDYYNPKGMSSSRKAEFEQWYEEKKVTNLTFITNLWNIANLMFVFSKRAVINFRRNLRL